ncbi:MAG: ribonuclease P protein component [Oscillospiraceae bacterium]|nr:ribonuclease P protein component [Oscillospiraceae bacterium]
MRHTVPLRQNREFRSLYARGKNTAGVYLALYARKTRRDVTRLGVSVSGKLGGAVTRNRVRRRIKEAYRLQEDLFAAGFDIVVVARSKAIGADFTALKDELVKLGGRLGVTV